jgi:hypothetical protein
MNPSHKNTESGNVLGNNFCRNIQNPNVHLLYTKYALLLYTKYALLSAK